jgi:hypothetical protein
MTIAHKFNHLVVTVPRKIAKKSKQMLDQALKTSLLFNHTAPRIKHPMLQVKLTVIQNPTRTKRACVRFAGGNTIGEHAESHESVYSVDTARAKDISKTNVLS